MVADGRKKRGRWGWRKRLALCAALVPLAVAVAAGFGLGNMNPVLVDMAEARARQLAVEAINRAVDEVMTSTLTYSDLVSSVTDGQGRVSMLSANTMLMNDLASQAALAAQRNLGELADQGVSIPLGAALGIQLFSGAGPRVTISVVPVGSVTMNFVTAFETAGINQTRHEISLEARVLMRIVIPAGANTVEVNAYVPIAESIIVGDVPDSYVNVPDVESSLNMVP